MAQLQDRLTGALMSNSSFEAAVQTCRKPPARLKLLEQRSARRRTQGTRSNFISEEWLVAKQTIYVPVLFYSLRPIVRQEYIWVRELDTTIDVLYSALIEQRHVRVIVGGRRIREYDIYFASHFHRIAAFQNVLLCSSNTIKHHFISPDSPSL